MANSDYSVIFITCENPKEAMEISRQLVVSKLAACCSVIPNITSYFEWDSKFETRSENIIMVKTKSEFYPKIQQKVQNMHSDFVPEIIQIEISNGLPAYLKWITDSLNP